LLHVPYRGGGALIPDLISGNLPSSVVELSSSLPLHRAGQARILAIAAPRRSAHLPDVPTAAEAGVPGVVAVGWNGIFAPAGTPPAIVQRVHADANAVLDEQSVQARLAELGAEATPTSQEAFQAFVAEELAKWRAVAQAAQVKLD
jgi:tripartite-type tricarboxylate transporter receptor subunit TctC